MTTASNRTGAWWVHTLRNPKVCLLLQRCCEIFKELLCDVPESTLLQLPSCPWCETVNLLQHCNREFDDKGVKSKIIKKKKHNNHPLIKYLKQVLYQHCPLVKKKNNNHHLLGGKSTIIITQKQVINIFHVVLVGGKQLHASGTVHAFEC